jgi:hypothetical protein
MHFSALSFKTVSFLSLTALANISPLVAQVCTVSTQNDLCLALTPNSNVLAKLPEALQVRNSDRITIHLANVSPLELCKLTGLTFTAEPPASAAQGAVTAIMGLAPFGAGGLLSSKPSKAETDQATDMHTMALKLNLKEPADPATELIKSAIKKQNDAIDMAKALFAVQGGKQQDGNAIAAMYSNFSVTDFRKPGTFGPAYKALQDALQENLTYLPPGEQAGAADATNRRVTADKSGGLLKEDIQVADPKANGITILDVQAASDEGKSLIGNAHNLYDKDLTKLALLKDAYASYDKLQSIATQYLALLNANDTALKLQQTNLMTLKLAVDQLHNTAFDAAGVPKENVDLAIPRARYGKVSGTLTCINRLDNTKVTLDPMPYSVDYQGVPLLAFSTGILFSPIQKQVWGVNTIEFLPTPPPPQTPPGTAPSPVTTLNQVALTDSSSFQVVPFSFLSLRLGSGWSYRLPAPTPGTPSTEGLYTNHKKMARFLSRRVFAGGITGGVGVNPNGGTTDPEYFAGLFGSVDRLMLHFGLDEGRIQNLGGGFAVNDIVPPMTTVPTVHHFVGKLSGAVSVRLYP